MDSRIKSEILQILFCGIALLTMKIYIFLHSKLKTLDHNCNLIPSGVCFAFSNHEHSFEFSPFMATSFEYQ